MIILALVASPGHATAQIAGTPSAHAPNILQPRTGPCHPALSAPDFVAGTDVDGHPVAPADLSPPVAPVDAGAAVVVERPLGARRDQTVSVLVDPARTGQIVVSASPCKMEPRRPSPH